MVKLSCLALAVLDYLKWFRYYLAPHLEHLEKIDGAHLKANSIEWDQNYTNQRRGNFAF